MQFAYDIVLVNETKAKLNVKMELRRRTIESQNFKLSRTKIEYLENKFSK